jgi:hexosaminidase
MLSTSSPAAAPIRLGVLVIFTPLGIGCATMQTAPTPRPSAAPPYALVPLPERLIPRPGEFRLDAETRIMVSEKDSALLRPLAALFGASLRAASGLSLPIGIATASIAPANAIVIRLDSGARTSASDESYRLVVNERGATLSAATAGGVVNGIETLRQLLPPELESGVRTTSRWSAGTGQQITLSAAGVPARWVIPSVEIEDAPRFRYRGILLDVARYYFPPEFLEKLVDMMATYKFNALQLHLTDDQGWRIEIKKYPKLTQIGAWRKESMVVRDGTPYLGDGIPHGGFYTQEQIRDLVAYAAARHVTIVPEIEMPGHAGAALAAYPELSCTGGPFEVSTKWGVHEDIFCPSEQTFNFLENVLTEVMELFPSEYIHVGGDEVPKTRWKASPVAQELIHREGLKNEEELQSYFIKRIERFLRAHGRKLIGWDEILEGGIAPEATVMSWRGIEGGIAAAQQGHDVIMSPTDYAYLDAYQGDPNTEPRAIGGFLPLDSVYAWEPVPNALTAEQAAHILGGQGNLWTEHVPTSTHAEYMLFPRMLAMSEVFWSPKESRNWESFLARMPVQLARLDALGVNYRVPDPLGLIAERKVLEDRTRVAMNSVVPASVIRYTTDGSEPSASSPVYTSPIDVRVTGAPVTVAARVFMPNGRVGSVVRERIARATWHAAVRPRTDSLQAGLLYAYNEGVFAAADDVTTVPPSRTGTVSRVALRGDEAPEKYGVHLGGYLHVPNDALYTLYLACDDGGKLRLDGELVVDHDGQHDATERAGQVALRAGYHAFDLVYFQAGGGVALRLSVSAPGLSKREVPKEWLVHSGDSLPRPRPSP